MKRVKSMLIHTVKQWKFILLASVSLVAIVVSFGQGCSKPFAELQSSSIAPEGDIDPSGYIIQSDKKTLSVVYNKQILDHYVSCTGIEIPSATTQNTWEDKRGTISVDGSVTSITAPMLMAATTIAGAVCDDLIQQEKVSPRLFNGVDWVDKELPSSDAILENSIRALALSCWGRPEASIERDLLVQSVRSQFSPNTGSKDDIYLYLCTAMLSSADAITF